MSKLQQNEVENNFVNNEEEFNDNCEGRGLQSDLKLKYSSIDQYVGQKLRDFREKVGLTLKDCSERLGISHQQIHKYEAGQTKIPSGMLYKFSKLFSITPNAFFEGFRVESDSAEIKNVDITTYPKSSKINILLVDNNSEDQFLLGRALEGFNDRVNLYCIHDGQEFMSVIKRRSTIAKIPIPDIIFFDLTIPKMEGTSILKFIKQDKDLRHIPVLVLTGSIHIKDVIESYKNYAAGYIRKSFDFETFKNQIQTVISYWVDAVVLPHHAWSEI